MLRFLRIQLACGLMALLPCALSGQECSVALGRLHEIGVKEYTYSWQMQYLQTLGENWAGSLTWLNEGHIPDHHRDGVSIQAWRFHRIAVNNLRLGLGLGLYRYFDTTKDDDPSGYRNRHGLKPILSLRAQYPVSGQGWEAFIQVNRTLSSDGPQTQGMLLGGSFRFASDASGARRETSNKRVDGLPQDHRNEVALMFGRTILNSFESESTDVLGAFALDYRRRLSDHMDVSIEYSDEGGIDSVKRDGLAIQGWLSARSAQQDWTLAFGVGPYFNRVFPTSAAADQGSDVNVRTSLRYSMMVSRTLWSHWACRLQWDRTKTSQHADTDVLLTGIVYQW